MTRLVSGIGANHIAANPQQGSSGAEVKISKFFRSFDHPIRSNPLLKETTRKLYTNVLTRPYNVPKIEVKKNLAKIGNFIKKSPCTVYVFLPPCCKMVICDIRSLAQRTKQQVAYCNAWR
jgi:hypothetical protein